MLQKYHIKPTFAPLLLESPELNLSFPSRQKFSSRHFVVPVVLYAIIFNLPKFFELKTSCAVPERPFSNRYTRALDTFQKDWNWSKFALFYFDITWWSPFKQQPTGLGQLSICWPEDSTGGARDSNKQLVLKHYTSPLSSSQEKCSMRLCFCIKRSLMTAIRKTHRYLNIYMLWLSTIFNIILPIVSLVLLNTFITRWTLSSSFQLGWRVCNTSVWTIFNYS